MPESVGRTLRKIREEKQLSIEEVSDKTHIPKKNICLIEEDKINEISSDFYAKAFVKTYAKFLSVSNEGLNVYSKEEYRVPSSNERSFRDWGIRYKNYIRIFIVLIISIIVVILGIVQTKRFFRKVSFHLLKKPIPTSTRAIESGIKLEISANNNTWLQITSEGKILWTGIFKKGANDIWRSEKEIKLEVGNARNVSIKVNGKALGRLGKKGEKKEIVITRDGVKE